MRCVSDSALAIGARERAAVASHHVVYLGRLLAKQP